MLFKILVGLMVLLGGLFLIIKKRDPRTLWLGWSFGGFLSLFFLVVILLLEQMEWTRAIIVVSAFLGIVLLFTPLLTFLMFLYNGIRVIQKEGFRFANTLTIGLVVSVVLYLSVWPMIGDWSANTIWNIVYQLIGFSVFYLFVLLNVYALTNILSLIHIPSSKQDYFIVLGAGLNKEEVTPLLAGRIEKGIALLERNEHAKLVLSGGQGADELIPEGEAMARYTLKKGVSSKKILKETHSRNTDENLTYSMRIIEEDWEQRGKSHSPKVAVVTNNYHVLRALLIARKHHIDCVGYGAKSKFYFSLNAFIREFVAYMVLTKIIHFIFLSFISLLIIGFGVIRIYLGV